MNMSSVGAVGSPLFRKLRRVVAWDAIDHLGRWVEIDDDTVRVVKEIERLWPELRIRYCENPDIGEAPYLLVERTREGQDVPIMSIWQLDSRLLDVIHAADTAKHDVQKMLDLTNDKARVNQQHDLAGWRDYCRDIITSAARHPGSSYKFKDPRPGHEGEMVKLEDDESRRTPIRDYSSGD
jgi:hypothetical protein